MKQALAIIITPEQLSAQIRQEVDAAMAEYDRRQVVQKELPVRLTCRQAAKLIGISERKFHRDYSHLKRRDAHGVYVASADITNM
jgi:hypothetical protein